MKRSQFVNTVKAFLNFPSVYAYGQMGSPISDKVIMERKPYPTMALVENNETTRHYAVTYAKSRPTAKTVPEGTFGADCTGLVQLALCGWKADKEHFLGGCDTSLYDVRLSAKECGIRCGYKGGVISPEKWADLKPGDIIFQSSDNKVANHVAVYIGDRIAVEVAYDWCGAGYGMKDGAQSFRLDGIDSSGKMATYGNGAVRARHWCFFGALPGIEDDEEPQKEPVIPEGMVLVSKEELDKTDRMIADLGIENAELKEKNGILEIKLEKIADALKILREF